MDPDHAQADVALKQLHRSIFNPSYLGFFRRMHFHALRSIEVSKPEDYIIYRHLLLWTKGRKLTDWVDSDSHAIATYSHNIDQPAESKDNVANLSQNTNLLGRLPPELLLDVAEYLDPADMLALRASCVWVHGVVDLLTKAMLRGTVLKKNAPIQIPDLYPSEAAKYGKMWDETTLRFHRDRYRSLAIHEASTQSVGLSLRATLLCSYCLDLHPSSSFSSFELSKGPYERVCVGAQATFRVCVHKKLTLKDIISLRCERLQKSVHEAYEEVSVCKDSECHTAGRYPPTIRELKHPPRLQFARQFRLNLQIRFEIVYDCVDPKHYDQVLADGRTPVGHEIAQISHADIREKLKRLDERICPHLRTSLSAVFEQLKEQAEHRYDEYAKHCNMWPAGSKEHVWPEDSVVGKCRAQGCGATFGFEIRSYSMILFEVWRELGWVTVTDIEWLAQADVEGVGGA